MTPAAGAGAAAGDDRSAGAVWCAVVVAALAFVPALHGAFVYDDHRFLAGNAALGSPSILWRAFTDPVCQTADGTHAGLWRPLRTLSYALDRALFGAGTVGPHAVNVLLHAAATWGVARLLRAWRIGAAGVALGACAYALHPVQSECVAWVSSRGDLLAAALTWAALLADLRRRVVLSLALGAAALLAKEQAVVWPALVVLSRWASGDGPGAALRAARRPALVVVAFVVLRHAVLSTPLQEGGLGQGPTPPAILASILAHQTWLLGVPAGLVFDWQMPWVGSVPLPALAWLLAGAVALAFGGPTVRVCGGWVLAALVPTWLLQAFVPLNILVADRFLLFALPAVAFAVGRAATRSRTAAVGCAASVLCLGALTETALPRWTSDTTLWTHTAARQPGHWRANAWLGIVALREGRTAEAEKALAAAAIALPTDAKTRYHLAAAQEALGAKLRDDDRIEAALSNYHASVTAFSLPRAEGASDLLPLARWAEADLLVWTGRTAEARTTFAELVGEERPRLGPDAEAAWQDRIARAAARLTTAGETELADRIRAAGRRP